MGTMKGKTRSGLAWTPKFLETIDAETCIGCGRCYKVCGRDVMNLAEAEEDEDGNQRMVMVIENAGNCIGCEACAKVCTKKCHTHAATADNNNLNDYVAQSAYQP